METLLAFGCLAQCDCSAFTHQAVYQCDWASEWGYVQSGLDKNGKGGFGILAHSLSLSDFGYYDNIHFG